jgi:hypothetical protein
MTANPTRVLNALFALTDDPDDIHFEERNGQPFIALGNISLALSLSSQDAIDKLATVTAQAAADSRARMLKAVG